MSAAVAVVSSQLQILSVNPAFEALVDLPAARLLGRPLDAVVASVAITSYVQRAVQTSRGLPEAPVIANVEGKGSVSCLLSVEPLSRCEAQGQEPVLEWLVKLTPISGQEGDSTEELTRSLALSVIFDQVPAMIYIKDRDGVYLAANRAHRQLTGRSSHVGLTDFDLFRRQDALRFRAQDIEVIQTGRPLYGLEDPVSVGGKSRWVTSAKVPYFNDAGEVIGVIGFSIDTTARHRSEKALARLRGQYKSILDAVTDGIIGVDASGRVVFINPAVSRILGYSLRDLLGRPLEGLVLEAPGDSSAPARSCLPLRETLRCGTTGTMQDGIFRKKDGQPVEVHATCAPIVDNGEVTGAVVVFRDITEWKRSEAAKERLTAIVEETPDFVSIATLDYNVLYYNRAARRMLGLEGEADLEDRKIEQAHPPWALQRLIQEGIPEALRHGVWRGETAILAADGREIPVLQVVLAHRSSDGRVSHLSTIAHDISDHKRAEAALRLQQAAKEREQVLTRFLQICAHELRNPMAGVKGVIGLAKRRLEAGASPEDLAPIMMVLEREIDRLAVILKDMLDAALVQDGRLRVRQEPVDLASVVKSALPAYQASESRHRVLLEDPDASGYWVMGDSDRLEEVVRNLVGNAIKYSPPGSEVRLSLHRSPERVRLSVQDQGIGIPPDQLETIFQRFWRVGMASGSDPGGMGLGLYLAKQIVESHGGRIWAESDGKHGSCFHLELPALKQPLPQRASEQWASESGETNGKRPSSRS